MGALHCSLIQCPAKCVTSVLGQVHGIPMMRSSLAPDAKNGICTVYFRRISKVDETANVLETEGATMGSECSAKGNIRHPVFHSVMKTLVLKGRK